MSRHDYSNDVFQNHIAPDGKPNLARIGVLNELLLALGHRLDVRTIIDDVETAPIRAELLSYAVIKGIDVRK
jgi:hypothetical protein